METQNQSDSLQALLSKVVDPRVRDAMRQAHELGVRNEQARSRADHQRALMEALAHHEELLRDRDNEIRELRQEAADLHDELEQQAMALAGKDQLASEWDAAFREREEVIARQQKEIADLDSWATFAKVTTTAAVFAGLGKVLASRG